MRSTIVVEEAEKYDARIVRDVLDDTVDVRITDAKTVDALVADAEGANAIIPRNVFMSAKVMDRLDTLEIVGIPNTGVGIVDHKAAADRGITVVNSSTYAVDEVSTHAMALLLACVRSITNYDNSIREGIWNRYPGEPIHRLQGRTLGLLAYGNIARRMAQKANGFGLNVIAHDPYVNDETFESTGVTGVGLDDLLRQSDLLSLHAPFSDETRGLIDAEAFEAMKENVILVNTGRGAVVVEAALIEALENGQVLRAGLDVFEREPLIKSHLLEREDVVLSPHVGWYSEESREDCIRDVAKDISRYFGGKELRGKVDPDAPWV